MGKKKSVKETEAQRHDRLRREFREMNSGITEAELIPPDAYQGDVDAAEKKANYWQDVAVAEIRKRVAVVEANGRIPDHHRTEAMTPTEAARRLGFVDKKAKADAGRKKVERLIKSGGLKAIRVSPKSKMYYFDKGQVDK